MMPEETQKSNALDAASTDELVDALLERCDHGVIYLYRDTGPSSLRLMRWCGPTHALVGMGHLIKIKFAHDSDEEIVSEDGEFDWE